MFQSTEEKYIQITNTEGTIVKINKTGVKIPEIKDPITKQCYYDMNDTYFQELINKGYNVLHYISSSTNYDKLFNPVCVEFAKPGDMIKPGLDYYGYRHTVYPRVAVYYMLTKKISSCWYARAIMFNLKTKQLELQTYSERFVYKDNRFTGRPNNIKEKSELLASFYFRFTNASDLLQSFINTSEEQLVKFLNASDEQLDNLIKNEKKIVVTKPKIKTVSPKSKSPTNFKALEARVRARANLEGIH